MHEFLKGPRDRVCLNPIRPSAAILLRLVLATSCLYAVLAYSFHTNTLLSCGRPHRGGAHCPHARPQQTGCTAHHAPQHHPWCLAASAQRGTPHGTSACAPWATTDTHTGCEGTRPHDSTAQRHSCMCRPQLESHTMCTTALPCSRHNQHKHRALRLRALAGRCNTDKSTESCAEVTTASSPIRECPGAASSGAMQLLEGGLAAAQLAAKPRIHVPRPHGVTSC